MGIGVCGFGKDEEGDEDGFVDCVVGVVRG